MAEPYPENGLDLASRRARAESDLTRQLEFLRDEVQKLFNSVDKKAIDEVIQSAARSFPGLQIEILGASTYPHDIPQYAYNSNPFIRLDLNIRSATNLIQIPISITSQAVSGLLVGAMGDSNFREILRRALKDSL